MNRLTGFAGLLGATLLAGCATVTPRDYGFRQVTMSGDVYYCAPREWVVPPAVPQEASNDPLYPMYRQFLALPERTFESDAHTQVRGVCITQAQWPQWLTIRTQWNRDWSVTPGIAEDRAAQGTGG